MESVFKWFFEEYLIEEFAAEGFVYIVPSNGITDLEKCKLIASEIDSVLKQFTLYVTEGSIDRELFQISSKHVIIKEVPSFCQEKYIYPNNIVCENCIHLLFSDQSTIIYTQKTGSEYESFYSLLNSEIMNIDDFQEYQKPDILYLLQNDCISLSEKNILTLNPKKVAILEDLYSNEVSCLQYLNQYRSHAMKDSNEVRYETSLFSTPEQHYLNYVLNRAEFSNGLDLRNKYIHGTHSLLSKDHKNDYLELLKVMVFIIIKINEEFCLRKA